jgi:hypothetical protein
LKKEQEGIEVPEEHQKLVMKRFDKVRKNPDRLFDWDKAIKTLQRGYRNHASERV